jgi:hypothetical protein
VTEFDRNRFNHGDRVRWATVDDDGLPVVRYGFVGGVPASDGPVVVMLDGELGGDVINPDEIEPVHMSNVTLILTGTDLLEDPSLRQGLVNLWVAEAETAGLEIASLQSIGSGVRDSSEGYALAELSSGGDTYVLRARVCPHDQDSVMVHADPTPTD